MVGEHHITQIAHLLAEVAAQEILPRFGRLQQHQIREKTSAFDLVTEADEAAERLIAALPDYEFALPGQLVADATVTAVDHRIHPEPRMTITCELLLLTDT